MRRALVALVMLAGCAAPAPRTQVMLEIDAEPAVRVASHQLFIEVFGGERDQPIDTYPSRYVRTHAIEPLRWPFRVALAPIEATPRGWVAVIALQEMDGTDVARTTVRGSYEEGRAVRVPVLVSDACIGVPCGDQRCDVAGQCVDPVVDVSIAPDLE